MKNKRPLAFSNEEPASLTKLEYFTAMAMQGLLSNPSYNNIANTKNIANSSIVFAKATLEALEKEAKNG